MYRKVPLDDSTQRCITIRLKLGSSFLTFSQVQRPRRHADPVLLVRWKLSLLAVLVQVGRQPGRLDASQVSSDAVDHRLERRYPRKRVDRHVQDEPAQTTVEGHKTS